MLAVAGALCAGVSVSRATLLTWDADLGTAGAQDGSGTWGATFFDGVGNVAATSADLVTFGAAPAGVGGAVTLDASQSVLGLVFAAQTGTGYTLGSGTLGTTLSIGASGLLMDAGSQASSLGNANLSLTLGAAQSWTSNSASNLTVAGAILNGANTLSLAANSTGNINISGVLGNGSGGVTVNGTGGGSVTLSGANTYSGTTALTSGVLRATTSANALGAGSLSLGGGELQLANDTGLLFNRNTTVTANAQVTTDRLTSGAGVTHTLGTLSIGANTLTVAAGANVASGTAGVTFGAVTANTGASIFTVNNPAVGTTLLTLGAVTNGASVLTFNGTGNTTVSGVLGGGSGGVTMSGTGTLTLSGANTFTGLTTINSGTVALGSTTALGPAATASVTMTGGTLSLGGNSTTLVDLTGAAGTITAGAGTPTLTINKTAGSSTFSGVLGGGTGTLALTKNGAGTYILSGANTYTGATTVNAGALTVSPTGSLSATTPITVAAGTLTLQNATQTAASLTLGGGAFGTTAAIIDSGTTLTLGGAITYSATNNPNGATIGGPAAIALGAATRTITVGDSTGAFVDLAISNSISGTGTIGLTKAGNGLLLLSGNNSYTGATTLSSGVLRATTSANALGGVGSALTLSGGELQLADDAGLIFANNATVGANVQITPDRVTTGAGTTETLGTLSLGAVTLTVAPGARVTSGSAGLVFGAATLTGSGTINTNNSVFTPAVAATTTLASVGSGTNVVTLTIGGTGNTIISGAVTTSGASAINKNGTGTLTFSSTAANTNTGALTINAGSVIVPAGGGLAATEPLTFGGTGNFNRISPAVGSNQGLGALAFNAGDGVVQSTYGTSGNASLTFASLGARAAGATGNLVVSGGANGTTNKITLTGAATGFINQGLFFNGTAFAFNDAGGFVRGINYGTDAGSVTSAATTTVAGTAHLQTSGAISGQTTATFTTLNLTGTSAFTLGTGATVQMNGILKTGGNAATLSGGTGIQPNASGSELVIRTDAAADALTISAPILANGANVVTKTGAGTLTLSGVNTFTGAININGGTIAIAGPGTTVDPTTLGAAGTRTINLNGGTFQITGGTAYGATTKTFSINSAGGTFDVGASTMTLATTANLLTGSGNLTLGGNTTSAGVLALAIASNFTGNIFVNAGTLQVLTAATAAGSGTIVVAPGAVLDARIGFANPFILNGTGVSGGGALISGATGAALTGNVTLASNSSIVTANAITLSGSVGDNGLNFGLTKGGTNTLILSGANSYGGGTTLTAGTLAIGNASALGTGALTIGAANTTTVANATAAFSVGNALVLNNDPIFGQAATNTGALTFGGAVNLGGATRTVIVNNPAASAITFSGPVSNGSLTLGGTGTLVLTGSNAYTGATTVNTGGTLNVAPAALGTTSAVTVGGSTTSTLNFLADNAGATIALAPGATMALGGASSSANVGLQLGSTSAFDNVVLTQSAGTGGTLSVGAGGALLSLTPLAGFGVGTYTLFNAAGGITGASNIRLATLSGTPGGFGYTLNTTPTTASLVVAPTAAGNLYWTNGILSSAGGSWGALTSGSSGTLTNWATDASGATVSPGTPGTLNTVNLSATNASVNPMVTTLDANFSVAGLNVLNSGTGAVFINTGTTGTLTVGAGGIAVQTGAPRLTTIGAPVALGASQVWNVADANQDLTLTGVVSGAFGLTKSGSGTLTLSGANTFGSATSTVTLSSGALAVNNATALGNAGNTILISGGRLDNTSGAPVIVGNANPQNWGADFAFNGAGNLTFSAGNVSLASNRIVTVNANVLTIGGAIGGSASLTKSGAGILSLTGANTFGGAGSTVTLNAGTLSVGNASALGNAANAFTINGGILDASTPTTLGNYPQTWNSDFVFAGTASLNLGTAAGLTTIALGDASRAVTVNANTLTVNGIVSGTAGSGLTKRGAGTLTLTAQNTFDGPVTVNAGTVQLNAVTGNLVASNALAFTGTGSFIYSNVGDTVAHTQTLGAVAVNAGAGSVTIDRSVAQDIFLNLGAITRAPGTSVLLAVGGGAGLGLGNGTSVKLTSTGYTPDSILAPGTFASVYTAATPTTYALGWYDALGFVRQINYGIDANTATVTGGATLGGNSGKEVQTTAAITAQTNDTFNSLNIQGAAQDFTLAPAQTLALGSGTAPGVLLRSGGGATIISGGAGITANNTGTAQELIIRSDVAADSITLSTPILASSGALTKTGAGTLILNAANLFTGTVSLNAGTLQANNPASLNGQQLALSGGTLALRSDGNGTGSPQNLAYANNVALNASATITADRLGAGIGGLFLTPLNKTFQLGTLGFLAPSATLTVSPANGDSVEFTGATTFDQPNLILTVNTNGATTSNVLPSVLLSGAVGGTQNWVKTGTGVLALTNPLNNFTGNITLGVGGAGTTSSGVLAFASDAALGNLANTVTLNGGTGAGATATLRAIGGTELSPLTTARTLNFWGIPANNIVEVAGGNALQVNSPFGLFAGFTKGDNGLLILNADNPSWAGAVSVAAGALRVNNAGALGSNVGGVTVTAAGGALQLNGVTIVDAVSINGAGINSAGAIQSFAGSTNTVGGLVTLTGGASIGADAGSTLNLVGGLTGAQVLTFAGPGAINVQNVGFTTPASSIVKIGTGATNWQVPATAFTGALTVNAGTFTVSGAGAALGGTGAIAVTPTATLAVDDTAGQLVSGAPLFNRLGGNPSARALTLTGGSFTYTGHATGVSSETLGATAFNRGGMDIVTINAGAAGANVILGAPTIGSGGLAIFRGTNLGSPAGANTATIASTTTGFTFTGAGTAGQVNKGIIPWALVDPSAFGVGTSFATADTATSILRPLGVGEFATSFVYGAASNIVLGGATPLPASFAENSLTLNAGGGVTILPMQTLTVAALLAQTGNTGIGGSTGFLTQGAGELRLFTNADLTIGSTISGGSAAASGNAALTKGGAGTLTLTNTNLFGGVTAINQGKIVLAAGTNTLAPNNFMMVGPGATLDLNGNVQHVLALFTDGGVAGAGGIVTGSAGSTLVINHDNAGRSWAGSIQGPVAVQRGGQNTSTWFSDNTYTGPTLFTAGTTVLTDSARLSGTASIDLNAGAVLTVQNTGTINLNDRINDAAPITFRGGTLTFANRAATASSETLGPVTLDQGFNTITITFANSGVNSADLTLSSLARTAGSPATINFTNSAGTLGVIGSAPRIVVSSGAPALTNNIIGAWATVNGTEWASYNPTFGVGLLNTAGFAGYDFNLANTLTGYTPSSTANLRINTVATTPIAVPSGGLVANTLNLVSTVSGGGLNFAAPTDVLNLTGGGLLHSGAAFTALIGTTVGSGQLTAGGSAPAAPVDLYLNNNAGAGVLTVNSTIIDNPNGGGQPLRLITTGGGTTSLTSGSTGLQVSSNMTNGSATITVPAGATATFNGQAVSGPGIAPGTTILSGGGTTTLVLSSPATATASSLLSFGASGAVAGLAANFAAGANPTFTLTSGDTSGLYIGQPIFGTNIPAGAIIATVPSATTFTITGTTTGAGTAQAITPGAIGNSYSGGTVVNGGTLTLNGAFGAASIPAGGLTINGGTVTMTTNAGQIAPTNAPILNGNSTLTLVGVNTLAGLTLNNTAGTTGALPLVAAGGVLTLTGGITATATNSGSVATISGTLDLAGVNNFSVAVSPVQFNGKNLNAFNLNNGATLNITAVIQNGGISVTGGGLLQLSGANTFAGGINIPTGSGVVVGNNAGLGTGLVTINPGALLTADGTARTQAAPLLIGGDFTLGNYFSAGIINSGTIGLGNGVTRTITGLSTAANGFSGSILGGGTLIKQGFGNLTLSGPNAGSLDLTAANAIQIKNGTLQLTNATGDAALGFVPGAPVANNIVIDGGVLSGTTGAVVLNTNRGITLGGVNNYGTIDASNVFTIPAVISGGALVKTGANRLDLAAANVYTGLTTVTAGNLRVLNNQGLGTTGAGTVVYGGGSLELADTNGPITISGETLTLNGVGTVGALRNISGLNTYAAPIIFDSSTRINSDAGVLFVTGPITANNSATLTLGGVGLTQFNSALNAGVAGLIKDGTGAALIAGNNTFAGPVTISAGALRVQNSNALGTTAAGTTVAATGGLELDGAAGPLTVGAEALTLNGTGVSATGALRNLVGANSYAGAITLGSATTIVADAGTLTLSGGISGPTFTVTIGGPGNTTLTTAGINTTTGGLVKADAGTLTIAAPSTYSGATAVNQGVLNVQNATALGSTSGVTVASGAALQLQGGFSFGTAPLTLNGAGAGAAQTGALVNVGGSNTFGGLITLGAAATISSDSGSLNLTNAGTISGATFGLTLTGAGDGTLASILGNTSGGLTKAGAGTWTLGGASTYTGATAVNGGTLVLDLGTGSLNAASPLTLGGGGFTAKGAATGVSAQTLGNLTLAAGANSRLALNSNGGTSTTLTLGTAWTRGPQATLSIDYTAANALSRIATTTAPSGATGANNVLGYALVTDATGSGIASWNGTSIVRLVPSDVLAADSNDLTKDFTTGTTLHPLTWTNGGALTNRAVNSLTINTATNSGTIDLGAAGNVLTLGSGAIVFSGAGSELLTGGQIGATNSEVIVHQLGAGTLTVGSLLSGGTGSLLKTGPGNLILSGLNTYSGPTTITAGTLRAGIRDQAFGINSAVNVASGATLDLNGFNQRIGSLAGNGSVNAGSSILALGADGTSTSFGGVISGGATLIKSGLGTLRLTNAGNTFNSLVVSQGVVVGNSSGAFGTGTAPFLVGGDTSIGGGTLMLAPGNGFGGFGANPALTLARNLSLSGFGAALSPSTQAAPQAFIVAQGALAGVGNATVSGSVTTSSSSQTRIVSDFGTLTLSGPVTLGTGNTQQFGSQSGNGVQPQNLVITGLLTGGTTANVLQKFGGGTLTLANAGNTFANNVQIDAGFVRVDNGAALGANVAANSININGGTLEIRSDAPGTSFSTKNVVLTVTGTIFASRGLNGSGLNQLVTFGNNTVGANNQTLTFSGRDGYSMRFGTGVTTTLPTGNPTTFTNSTNGTLTLANNYSLTDGLVRTFTVQGNAESVILGNLLGTSNFAKAGTGMLTLQGTASALTGNVGVNAGTVAINSFNALNNVPVSGTVTSMVNIAANGALNYLGAPATGAGETVAKSLNLTGTGSSAILANQTGTAPTGLVLSSLFSAITGAKTLFLGGNAAASVVNEAQAVISDSGTNVASLTKVGSGTWLLDPSAASYAASLPMPGVTGTTSGIAAAKQNTLTIANTSNLLVGQAVAGTNIPGGSTVASIDPDGIHFTISNALVSQVNNGTNLVFTSGTGTNKVTVSNTAGLVVGQPVTGTNIPAGSVVTSIIDARTFTINNNIATVPDGTTISAAAIGNFTGALTLAGGTLQARPTAASGNGSDVVGNAVPLTFATDALTGNGAAGGTFEYIGTATAGALTETVGSIVPTAGAGTIKLTANGGTPTLAFGATTPIGTRTAGATLNFLPDGGAITFTAGDPKSATTGIIGGYATVNGVDWATTTGAAAPFTLAPYSAYTALAANSSDATKNFLLNAGTITTAGAASASTLKLTGASTLTLGGTMTLAASGVLFDNSTGAATIANNGNAMNTLGANNVETIVTINGSTPANALTISANIGGGTGSLTKAGAGTLVISGSNSYTGNTVINEGTLRLSGPAASLGSISTAGNVTTIRQGATLDINAAGMGNTVTIGALAGAGTVTNSGAGGTTAATLAIGFLGNTTAAGVFSGLLQDGAGVLHVTKNGTGAESLTGLNTYSGVTTINAGTIAANTLANIGTPSSIGQGVATSDATNAASLVFNGGTLQYTGSNATIYQMTQTPSISIDRLFTLAGNGTIDSSGQFGNSVLAAGAQNNAALIFNKTSPIAFSGSGSRLLTLTGNSTGDNEIDLQLVNNPNGGALALTKAGGSVWVLGNATNNYTGPTTISAGILRAQDGAGLSSGSNLVISGGVLESSGTFSRAAGTGAGQVQWNANSAGGFAAAGSKLTVNLGGGAQLDWGVGGFMTGSTTAALLFGSATTLAETEFANPFSLGTGFTTTRNIQVDDNGTTSTDYTTVSGSITGSASGAGTGTAALTKTGGGVLILTGSNTFTGGGTATAGTGGVVVNNGTLVINSFAGGGPLGALNGAGDVANRVVLGSGANTPNLIYVGAGETVQRRLELAGGSGTVTLESDGSGAMILSDVVNTATAARIFQLRGSSVERNEISSVLANNGTNTLAVTKTDQGVWMLSGNNTYTGATNVSAGILMLGSDTALGTSAVTTGNAAIQSIGGTRTLANNFLIANANLEVSGQNSFVFNGTFSGNNATTALNNFLPTSGMFNTFTGGAIPAQDVTYAAAGGKTLTLNGTISLQDGTNPRTFTLRGSGATIINGQLQNGNTAAGTIQIEMAANGTLGTAPGIVILGAGSLLNPFTGNFNVSTGVLQLNTPAGTYTTFSSNVNVATSSTTSNAVTLAAAAPNTLVVGSSFLGSTVTAVSANGLTVTLAGSANAAISTSTPTPYSATITPLGANNSFAFVGGGYLQAANDLVLGQGFTMGGSGIIQGSSNLTFNGAGLNTGGNQTLSNNLAAGKTLTLAGSNFVLSEANQARVATFAGTGTTVITGPLVEGSGTGADSLTKAGSGVLLLQGVNTFAGGLTVTGGLLDANFNTAANNQLGSSTTTPAALTLGAATLRANKTDGTTSTQTYSATTLNANSSPVLTLNVPSGTLTLNTGTSTSASTITRGGQSTLQINLQGAGTSTVNVGAGTTLANWLTLTNSTGTFYAAKDGSNNLVPAVPAAKNDVTTWGAADNVTDGAGGFSGIYAGTGAASVNTVRFNQATASIVNVGSGAILNIGTTTNGGGILVTPDVGANNSTIAGGVLTSTSGELIISQQNPQAGNTLTISSRIENPTTVTPLVLTKAGPGTLLLTGTNSSFSGTTSINDGTLRISGGSAIGDRSTVLLANNPNSVFDVNNSTETMGSLSGGGLLGNTLTAGIVTGSITVGGTVTIGTGNLTVNQTANTTYSGLITGSGSLTVTGTAVANTLTLNTATNPFSGSLTVSGAQLAVANGTLGSGVLSSNLGNVSSVTIRNGGGLNIDTSGALQSNRLNDAAPIALSNTPPNAAVATVGLNFTSDQTGTLQPRTELVGPITLGVGSNTIRVNATANQVTAQLTAASLNRGVNNATLVVLGTNMDDPISDRRGDFNVSNSTNLLGGLIGGGSLATGTPNISILPWAIGSNAGANATATGSLGNSFVTYGNYAGFANGFRALSTAEYEQLSAGGGTTLANNARYSAATGLTLTGTGHAVNSLLVDSNTALSALAISGSGAGDSLAVGSGAFLFISSAGTAQPITIGGFNAGITTGSGQYVFNQNNTAAGGVTIASNLASVASVVKTGPGLLILTGTSTTVTGVTVNQGALSVSSPAAVNNQTINLNGGSLGFFADVNGLGTIENFNAGTAAVNILGDSGLTVDRLAANPPAILAANKTAQYSGIISGISNQTLTINNNNGYGLELNGATLALGTSAPASFNVVTATDSTRVQGLTISSAITGGPTGAANSVFIKTGLGTLVLNGPASTFGGGGSAIEVQNGVLSIASANVLGNVNNVILLNPASGNVATLRATDDLVLARTVKFGTLSSTDLRAIEVST
ncbi:MAG: autotransporter-associated beta strand repeat-containing protein, partial [Chthoniobacteraceae bacterium]